MLAAMHTTKETPRLRLRQVRKYHNLTLQDLEAKTGLSFQQLSKYELGIIDPPSSKLLSIALALGVEVGDLYPDTTNGEDRTHA